MFEEPIIRLVWALAPAAITFGLSFLPESFKGRTALSADQAWGCRAVSAVFAVLFGIDLLLLSSPFLSFVSSARGSAWVLELLLLLPSLVGAVPVSIIVFFQARRTLRGLGLTRSGFIWYTGLGTATYFFLVFLRSTAHYIEANDWSFLYTSRVYGSLLQQLPVGHALLVVTLVVISACVEEFIFRGFALPPLARVMGPFGGVVATALFWSMAHFESPGRTLGLFFLGVALGGIFYLSGSIVPTITLHALWNLGAVSDIAFAWFARAGVHWSNEQHFLYIGIGSLVIALAAVLVALLEKPPQTR